MVWSIYFFHLFLYEICFSYSVNPVSKCRLRQLRLERIKDHLLLEQEFIQNAELNKPKAEETAVWLFINFKKVDFLFLFT